MHDAILWAANVDAFEAVLGRNLAFDELGYLPLNFAQLGGNLAAQILIYLDDLQFDLRRAAVGLCDGGCELAVLTLKPYASRSRAVRRSIETNFFAQSVRTLFNSTAISSISRPAVV